MRSAVDQSGIDVERLSERVTLERPVSSSNDLGERVRAWEGFAEVWAGVEQLSGNESVQAGQLHATASHLVLIRFREGINEQMRVRLSSGQSLAIANVDNWERRNVALFLTCTEDKQRG